MKYGKWICLIVMLGLMLVFALRRNFSAEPAAQVAAETPAYQGNVPESSAGYANRLGANEGLRPGKLADSVEYALFAMANRGELGPEAFTEYAVKNGLQVSREVLGHPKSGQRLELVLSGHPEIKATFDIMTGGQYQFSALRANYKAGTPLGPLKEALKAKHPHDVRSEDEDSLVLAADTHGHVAWLQRSSDGSVRMALEFSGGDHQH